MTFNKIFSILIATAMIFLSNPNSLVFVNTTNGGFYMDLVHRDSPQSPFYDHSLTPSQRVANAVYRSINAVSNGAAGSIDMMLASSAFLIKSISIGSGSAAILAIADTGSSYFWIQCEPCTNCSKQKNPIFDPKESSTYKHIPCSSDLCKRDHPYSFCNNATNTCAYSLNYSDGSYTKGSLDTEKITLASSLGHLNFSDVVFGCGHENKFMVYKNLTDGIIGLGPGPNSFISQILSRVSSSVFTYCLTPLTSEKPGKLYIGDTHKFPNPRTTALFMTDHYMASLIGITIDGQKVVIVPNPTGNMILDTATTMTYLPTVIYNDVEAIVKKIINAPYVNDPTGKLKLCYHTGMPPHYPEITLNFYGGANLSLPLTNSFIQVRSLTCLAILPHPEMAMLGSYAQANLFFGFDIAKKQLSFGFQDCHKL